MVKHNNVIPNGHFKGQTLKYNMKIRAGRGFSLEKLKASLPFVSDPEDNNDAKVGLTKQQYHQLMTLLRPQDSSIMASAVHYSNPSPSSSKMNSSLEGFQTNVNGLKTYKAKLVIFPRRAPKSKAGDSTPEELATATQV
ncbi:unnamed protein product [Fraxinus pennsylvanica]|uniref:Uncharacterized protein n=1 Tax=Fraxinus pennsylvanica TaxID=56036 RepID=A0AAD2EH42_9LAMI|nr:unnamed protein product [Fraxinus pennsylvanica]